MNERTYRRTATVCLLLGVGSVVVYELGGEFTWIGMGLATAAGLTAATTYLFQHVRVADGGKEVIQRKGQILLPDVYGEDTLEGGRLAHGGIETDWEEWDRRIRELIGGIEYRRLGNEEEIAFPVAQAMVLEIKRDEQMGGEALAQLLAIERGMRVKGGQRRKNFDFIVGNRPIERLVARRQVQFIVGSAGTERLGGSRVWSGYGPALGRVADWVGELVEEEHKPKRSRAKVS